jgi:hypothetical protein
MRYEQKSMKRQGHDSRVHRVEKGFYAEKSRQKERIWAMEPNRAQDSASIVPPAEELESRKSRAWI